jgi:peptidoglycan/xylan/chitin deacetylase (PgdA/CDA1 family)
MKRVLPAAVALLFAAAPVLRAQTIPSPTAPSPTGAPLQVAFTFDDLPAHGPLPPGEGRPEPVRSILRTLKAEHMPPVYGFVNGFRVRDYPYQRELLTEWVAAGQPLGNHTFEHPSLEEVSAKEFIEDIEKDEKILRQTDPQGDWHWFRYPYLNEGETLAKREAVRSWLFAHQYKIAEVTLDFEDYLWNDTYARCAAQHDERAVASLEKSYLATADQFIGVFRGLSHELYGRDIPYVLLLHVGAFDARMLPRLIALFRARGFQFVTLPQAEQDPAYGFDPHIGYKGGGTLEELVAKVKGVNFPDDTYPEKQLDRMCRR